MKAKSKVSPREVWLLALLPAALVLIVSFALPSPADEVAELEQRLERFTANEGQAVSQLREYSKELQQSNQQLKALKLKETVLSSQIQAATKPQQRRETLDMAGALDELARRLSSHGAQVLAMAAGAQGSAVKASKGQSAGVSNTVRREWIVSVVATWPVVRTALADAQTFPKGLALSAMNMEQAQPNGTLRRWELVVIVAEQS